MISQAAVVGAAVAIRYASVRPSSASGPLRPWVGVAMEVEAPAAAGASGGWWWSRPSSDGGGAGGGRGPGAVADAAAKI